MNGYLLIGSAAMLFSLQFLFQRQFQAEKGSGLHAAILFSLGANLVICLVMLPVMQLMDGRLLYGASRRAFCLAFLLAGVNIKIFQTLYRLLASGAPVYLLVTVLPVVLLLMLYRRKNKENGDKKQQALFPERDVQQGE